jgi:hypothetical protein
MARTPEEINRTMEGLDLAVSSMEALEEHGQFMETVSESDVLSEGFKARIRWELDLARYKGVLEGRSYDRGEIELPDIEEIAEIELTRPVVEIVEEEGRLNIPEDHINPGA